MRLPFVPFTLEREMSIWENQVAYNLSESGVHPLTIRELVQDPEILEDLLTTELTYPQTNGRIELREQIAGLYAGAGPQNVLVTTGAAQANFATILTQLQSGDEIVIMLPNYMQIWGIAMNFGLQVKTFPLKEELGWAMDIETFERTVSNRTKLIAICNPNNPTGHILSEAEMTHIVRAADHVGAWILSDEVYAGAERVNEQITPSFWGRYERVFAIGSLSKAYGLPGLRLGWVVTTPQKADEIWSRQDYITISTTMLANKLAAYALSTGVRQSIIARTRKMIREGYQNFELWRSKHVELFDLVPPQAAAVAFVRYKREINSSILTDRLREEKQTYMVPGDHFGIDHHLRISYGLPKEYLNEGLERLYQVIASVD
jgi:aspartate/methionine/tyrosine aminotransferase